MGKFTPKAFKVGRGRIRGLAMKYVAYSGIAGVDSR
jgi:hypothetical protein